MVFTEPPTKNPMMINGTLSSLIERDAPNVAPEAAPRATLVNSLLIEAKQAVARAVIREVAKNFKGVLWVNCIVAAIATNAPTVD